MPVIRFAWDAQLVSVRREACPNARWNRTRQAWTMTEQDAAVFLLTAQARLDLVRIKGTITVDDTVWVLGSSRGTPYGLNDGVAKRG